ncbi:tyrosine-type recombinase/integrase [Alteribacillus sp. YIM 98480]|uniref:tyrosine-type recombinase/integrase n=1 Tax=Alteribacillus sp. YIM 98480 TaxID=2606599 RepID=UPI00131D80D2|nr:tyrosine-type recombinase/integrase [Alteribacillus sp. YIM 98480]
MASYQRRGDNSFLLVAELGYDANGRRRKKTKTIKIEDKKLLRTKKRLNDHIEKELYKFQMEVESGEYIKPEKMSLNEFVKHWEKNYAEDNLSPGTLESYKSHLKVHILPVFGDMRLEQIKPKHILDFLSDLKKEKELSGSTIQYAYRVMRNVFERAAKWEFVQENIVAKVERPKAEKRKVNDHVYDEQEVEGIFKEMETEPIHWQVFISLALACGFRRGENLALETDKIDWDKKQIRIDQSIVRGEKGRALLKDPKSYKSTRVVTVPDSIMLLLKQLHMENTRMRSDARDRWKENNHNWLFCNDDGTHFYPTTPTTWWKRFTKRKNIRYIRLHDLRHTSATFLINQGVHAKVISERLGHADIRITMDTYGHVLEAADQEAANKINDIFTKKEIRNS